MTKIRRAEIPMLSATDVETTILLNFRFEMRKTRLQFSRIKDDRAELEINGKNGQLLDLQAKLFADINFLFVCLKKLDKLFKKMKEYFPGNSDLVDIGNRYGKYFKPCKGFRDDFEHIDERPEEGVKYLGSTFDTVYYFGDKEIDINLAFERKIEEFFKVVDSIYDKLLIEKRKRTGMPVLLRASIKVPK